MTVLLVGASGATGRLLVNELLCRGYKVRVVVRSSASLPEGLRAHFLLSVIQANIIELNEHKMAELVNGCTAVASCLGHNLTFRGIFGSPRKLVTNAVERLCEAVKNDRQGKIVRFVLMNTAGNSNRNLAEPISWGERCIVGLIRCLIPPHRDNEMAADYLQNVIGTDNIALEWVAIRPDTLVNETAVTPYDICPSPTRSAIFNPGKTSRINVAHFMATLITEDNMWNKWKGKMPVIYNKG